MTFKQTVNKYISTRRLLGKGGKYLVALSGGPDSVALLRVLKDLGYNIEAAHCNFHLRGAESDRDEEFCKSLCKQEGIPLHIVHFDTISYAQLHKVSIEMAARRLRYQWFAQLCTDIDAKGICVAHHQDDQVETVLLNLLRGTGIKGLTGMKGKTTIKGLTIFRPLLCVNERQILAYLQSLNQGYVIDSSNLKDDVLRNKLRLDIIPMLEKVNPSARKNILRMTENLQDIQAIVNASLDQAIDAATISPTEERAKTTIREACSPRVVYAPALPGQPQRQPLLPLAFSLAKVHSYPAPGTLLWSVLSPYGFNRTQMEEIAACKTDNKAWRSNSHVAIISHDSLLIVNRNQWERPMPTLRIPEPGTYRYDEQKKFRVIKQQLMPSFEISKERFRVNIDAKDISFPLIIRPVKAGDRFTPFGLHGSKLASDYLKDRKRSIIDRHNQLVLTDCNGNILWLAGECIDNHYKVEINKSKEVLTIEQSTDN